MLPREFLHVFSLKQNECFLLALVRSKPAFATLVNWYSNQNKWTTQILYITWLLFALAVFSVLIGFAFPLYHSTISCKLFQSYGGGSLPKVDSWLLISSKSKPQRRRKGMFGFSPWTAVTSLIFRILHNKHSPKNTILAYREFDFRSPKSNYWPMCCSPIVTYLNTMT